VGNGIAREFFWSHFAFVSYEIAIRGVMLIVAGGNPQPLALSDSPDYMYFKLL